jgi:RNA polymerase sigma-70 factor (ECF subfamily)
LVARATAYRDPGCFGMLVERHQSRVRGYLRQLARDRVLADDLAQETFMRGWEKLATFSGRGRFSAWLLSIAHNTFLQWMRRSTRESRLLADVGMQAKSETPDAATGRGPAGDDAADLPRFLAVLSDEERAVMVLAYGYGYSHGEIVEVTGMPLGTVKSHLHRAKARIRERFGLEGSANA